MDPNARDVLVTDSALNPYAAPASTSEPASASPLSFVTGPRVAGAIMIATVPAALLGSRGGQPATTYLAIVFDVLIGVSLVRGNLKYRLWAVLRCLLGLLIYGGPAIARSEVAEAIGIVAYSGSLLVLLVGTPGKARTIIGTVAATLLCVVAYVGLLLGG